MYIKLLFLVAFLQGNPTYLYKNDRLTIRTEIVNDRVFMYVNESLIDPIYSTRNSVYEVADMKLLSTGRIFYLSGGCLCYIPNNLDSLPGTLIEINSTGSTAIQFKNGVGIIKRDTMKY